MNVEGIMDDNNSNIKENSTSAFLEYARSFGKLQAQLGVRYEHLSSDYYEDGKYMDEQDIRQCVPVPIFQSSDRKSTDTTDLHRQYLSPYILDAEK